MREDGYQVTGDRWQGSGEKPSIPGFPRAERSTLHASSRRGFTLVEILGAIAILAVDPASTSADDMFDPFA